MGLCAGVQNEVGPMKSLAQNKKKPRKRGFFALEIWCPEAESNHRHEDFQSSALPTELSGLKEGAIKAIRLVKVKEGMQRNLLFYPVPDAFA